MASFSQKGFVLPLALVLLAIASMSAAYFAEIVTGTMQDAERQQANTEALLKMYSARADMLFRLGTTPITALGLGADVNPAKVIALDDRAYHTADGTIVQMQDNRGLINLNNVSNERLSRLLNMLGVPYGQHSMLIDTLADYIDTDNLKRLNGGEEMEYRSRKLPPPRNSPMITPFEARNVLGWREQKTLWKDDALSALTTTAQTFATNPTTAPWQVLATIPGVTPELAKQLVALRALRPLTQIDVANILALPAMTQVFEFSYLPANSVRITQRIAGLPLAWRYSVTLTPMTSGKEPWQIDYFYRTVVPSADDKANSRPLPPRNTATAAPPQNLFSGNYR